MTPAAIGVLAAFTLAFRLAGPLLHGRLRIPARLQRTLEIGPVVLLVALVVTASLIDGNGPAGWARPAGVLAAGMLAYRRAPFPVVVLAAAAVTAMLRLLGVA